ncbi:uncharacterized protein TNCV_2656811 [Trichonephila clavipes]|nr:uncharacterized protein TNCV_2656811 [Trichonephila clavipes]
MITNFFIPELNNHDVQELWFQQDGATCHTARATIDLLKDTFGDHLISRFGPVNCPPRACDLTPLDYFLWGYVKSLVYADKPQTLDHLEDNIHRVIADIRAQMLEKVIENWTSRLDYIRASRNGTPYRHINCGSTVSPQRKGRIEAFTTGSPHTNTIVITVEIESGFVAKDDLVPFRCSSVSSCVAPFQTEASRIAHVMGAPIQNVFQPGTFLWFEMTEAPSKGATCAWMEADEAVGCTRAFLTM